MKNWLKVMVAISALLVAGCAAFFSVTGLGVLFSGASIAVMVMAGSLEFAKLITATYLKQSWEKIHGFNKWYLTGAVGILMVITSAGIFGYLSNAFQQQNIKLEQVQREISVWDNKISSNENQVKMLNNQVNNLYANQGKIFGLHVNNRSLLKSVDNRDKEESKIHNKISSLQDSSVYYNSKINDVKNNNIGLEREVGGFRFVAEAFGVELKNVVKFFIILIVIVFDPLALALIIAFNQLVMGENDPKEEEVDVDDIKNIISESDRLKPSEKELKNIENILVNKPYVNKEDILKPDGVLNVTGEIKPDGEIELPKVPYTPPKSYESNDEQIYDTEEQYIPSHDEEKQNHSTMTPPEQDNGSQQEDYKGQFEDWKNETVSEPFATEEEVKERSIDVPVEESSKIEIIDEPSIEEPMVNVEESPIQEIPEEKKK